MLLDSELVAGHMVKILPQGIEKAKAPEHLTEKYWGSKVLDGAGNSRTGPTAEVPHGGPLPLLRPQQPEPESDGAQEVGFLGRYHHRERVRAGEPRAFFRRPSRLKAALKKMQYAQAAPLDENYGPQAWLSKEKYHG